MRFCNECGAQNKKEDLYCFNCGEKLTDKNKVILLDNRYEQIEIIGNGGMGCVIKAIDTRLQSYVALKKLIPSHFNPEESSKNKQRFEMEAKLLNQLHHSNIPKVIDYFETIDPENNQLAFYLVMTFCPGNNLKQIMGNQNGKPMELKQAYSYFSQLLDALHYIHSRNPPVIHRDIKASNVIIDNEKVFLVDFGIAKNDFAKPGTAIGTFGYAPPEQYKGIIDEKIDIYSLGVLMHYLLSGKDPENSNNVFHFEPVSQYNPVIPSYISDLVASMVNKDPEQRPQNINSIIEKLGHWQKNTKKEPEKLSISYSSPLFNAVKDGDLKTTEKLLEMGNDPNEEDEEHNIPILFAINRDDHKMLKKLIEYGAKVNYVLMDEKGYIKSTLLAHCLIRDAGNCLDILLKAGVPSDSKITQLKSGKEITIEELANKLQNKTSQAYLKNLYNIKYKQKTN